MKQLTSIIILAYNQLQYTKICIESLQQYTKEPYELILVNNGSQDRTNEYFHSIKGARVISNQENKGFAKGVNQGIKKAKGQSILLLNNDTVVTKNWLKNLRNCLMSNKEIGIVGPRTNRCGNKQRMDIGFKDLEEMHLSAETFNQQNKEKWFTVNFVSGFCMLIKREVIDSIGLFDEHFLIGVGEDNDYSYRAIKAGYLLLCAGDTFIYHFKDRTFLGNKMNKEKIVRENHRRLKEKWGHS